MSVHSPVQYDVVVSLLSGKFIGRRYSGDGQQRLQKDRQAVVDRVRHLDVLIAPTGDKEMSTKNRAEWKCFGRQREEVMQQNVCRRRNRLHSLFIHLQAPGLQLHRVTLSEKKRSVF